MSGIGAKADKVRAFIDFGFMVSGPADSNGAVTNAQQRIRSQSAFAGDAHHGTLGRVALSQDRRGRDSVGASGPHDFAVRR
jgi:hypothetical protein